MSAGTVTVVGGGVAGLCSGIYAAANGYETTIFEAHTLPGGLCTSWNRQGYTFDGCIHWFVGGKPGSGFRRMWDEVGATEGISLVPHDRLSTVRDADGNELTLWADLDRLRRDGLATWPGEGRGFDEVVRGARAMARTGSSVPDTPPDMMGGFDGLKMLVKSAPSLAKMRKYMNMSMRDVAEQFHDPALRQIMLHAINEPRMGAMAFLGTMGWFEAGDANWVGGGSLGFARKLERRFLDLGGEISYGSRVERILVESDRAVGVRLADGSEHRADHVIGAADGHATIFEMLDGRYADDRVRNLYDKLEPFSSLIQVSLGVDMDLSQEPWSYVLLLEDGSQVGDRTTTSVWTHHYAYDPTMAPAGKSCVTAILGADLEPWKQLRDTDRAAYEAMKASVGQEVISIVERAYPGIGEHVEVVDVATPATYVRYTGNWKGSFEGWLLSPENTQVAGMGGLPRRLPGLSNFVMAGQWVWPGGGLPSGVLTGRWAAQTICADDSRSFVAPA
ncbi:MAG TPA: NAD(P)/FAD-dependent oxidoreductase [Coriobacteriia bacterium]|nr:NAD(P)/FAD-dependent oxidoreductase [Coriobacteriia bacterium]